MLVFNRLCKYSIFFTAYMNYIFTHRHILSSKDKAYFCANIIVDICQYIINNLLFICTIFINIYFIKRKKLQKDILFEVLHPLPIYLISSEATSANTLSSHLQSISQHLSFVLTKQSQYLSYNRTNIVVLYISIIIVLLQDNEVLK